MSENSLINASNLRLFAKKLIKQTSNIKFLQSIDSLCFQQQVFYKKTIATDIRQFSNLIYNVFILIR
ncbi:MAG: hypothetical protein CME37_19495 [Haliea sp.]|nr:hypothetical protein [Haliea sp.]